MTGKILTNASEWSKFVKLLHPSNIHTIKNGYSPVCMHGMYGYYVCACVAISEFVMFA